MKRIWRGWVLLVALALAFQATSGAAPPRPNLVLFIADDLGIDFTGCYGNTAVRTPHLDALARAGLKFTHMFAASPTCSPSRAAMLTGLWPQRNGTMGNHTDCRPGIGSLPQFLHALGYRVVLADKGDVRPASVFDFEYLKATLPKREDHPRMYRGEGLDTAAVDTLLANHAREKPGTPLCLVIGDNCPHVVWEPNRDFDPEKLPLPPIIVDTPAARAGLANYYQDIRSMDTHLGDVLASLDKHGMAANTLVICTSDQGPEWPHAKWTCYDAGLRVPFIVRWPGKVAAGEECDALASLIDVTPTFVEAAGGAPPSSLDGRSLLGIITGSAKTHREFVFATHTGDGEMNRFPQRSVRDGRYKLIVNLHPEREWTTHFTKVELPPPYANTHKQIWDTWVEKARTDPPTAALLQIMRAHPVEELYDTRDDPFELRNLATHPDMKPVRERLRRELDAWRRQVNDLGDD